MGTRGRPDTRVATDSPFARYKHKKARQSHRRNAFNLKKDSSLSEGLLNQHESWTFAKYFIPQAATFAVNLAGSREEKKREETSRRHHHHHPARRTQPRQLLPCGSRQLSGGKDGGMCRRGRVNEFTPPLLPGPARSVAPRSPAAREYTCGRVSAVGRGTQGFGAALPSPVRNGNKPSSYTRRRALSPDF